MLDMRVFDRCPRSRRAEMRDLVDAYVAMTSNHGPGGQLSSDDALWRLWSMAGTRYAADLVEALILAVGPSVTSARRPGGWT